MWSYSEAAIEPSPYKTIILYFLTTTCKSYFLVKLQVWIIHVGTWRRFGDDTTSMRLHTDFLSTFKQLFIYEKATLQNKKLRQKYFSRILNNGAEQLSCKKSFGVHLFRILHFV